MMGSDRKSILSDLLCVKALNRDEKNERVEMSSRYVEELFGLSGQVAVVIGGTGVLGGALAQGLGQAGATVVVAGRDAERGEARVREIADAGGKGAFAPVDVMRRASIEELLRNVLDTQGRVDMLI